MTIHDPDLLDDQQSCATQNTTVVEHALRLDHAHHDTHLMCVKADFPPVTFCRDDPTTIHDLDLLDDHPIRDTQRAGVVEHSLRLDQSVPDAQENCVKADLRPVGATGSRRGAKAVAMGGEPKPSDPDYSLVLYADTLDDLELARMAATSRLAALEKDKGLDGSPEAAKLAGLIDGLSDLERQATNDLKRAMRSHPLGVWVSAQCGIGEKSCARLLGAIGNPAARATVSQLWAYCGLDVWHLDESLGKFVRGDPAQPQFDIQLPCGGIAPHRRRGQRITWSPKARSLVWVCTRACVYQLRKPCAKVEGTKWAVHVEDCQCSPYRLVYDTERIKQADAVHGVSCVKCGSKGNPAPIGSPLSERHKKGRAYRRVSKEILKDLWREARRLDGLAVY